MCSGQRSAVRFRLSAFFCFSYFSFQLGGFLGWVGLGMGRKRIVWLRHARMLTCSEVC